MIVTNPLHITMGYSSDLRKARKATNPDPESPFVKGADKWFAHAKKIVDKVWPGRTLENGRFNEVLLRPGFAPMQWSDANTARVNFKVTGPAAMAGDEITLVLDRADGKALDFAYWKKRT